MRILVTRPEPDASAQASVLEKLGHSVIISPLLEVETCAPAQFDLAFTQAVIATSRNALRAIANHPDLPALTLLPLFTVGPNTTETAHKLGFKSVITGPAAAVDLVPVISDNIQFSSTKKRLLYLAPEQPAFNLAGALEQAGFSMDIQVVYRTKPADGLTVQAKQAISDGTIDAAIIMSARTAATFVDQVNANGLQKLVGRIMFLCLSDAVAVALQDLNPRVVEIAIRPRAEEMLALVHRMTAKFS